MSTPASQWAPIALSTVEFEVCWERLHLGEPPYVLEVPSPGRTHEERQQIVESVLDGLRYRGLADGHWFHPDLVERMELLADCSWAVDARLIADRMIRARGAVAGRRGVLAVIDEETVTLSALPDHLVLGEVVALAGDAPVGRSTSASVRAATLDAAAEVSADARSLAENLIREGERPDDARALAHMLSGVGFRGQFSVVVGNRRGPWVVGFHNTPESRHLQLRRNGWVTIAPVSGQQLVRHVRELLDATPRD
ncbi:ESX secretion-associated protein EspG [Longimycelium tulufanense]|uniref:ESX secretion-associated protein EspG n=1 Tax=Longimycelium tulufanense TaxID=907463 RepID=A0A8J3CH43_9PSEU|nr:ESX secretion-associated protein EspG [Longimycelium tulufanense]GGM65503.1 ESX secretion-associated protein EspG [Longimycelium tulufanense]